MGIHFHWEDQLLPLALKALESERAESGPKHPSAHLLDRAHRHCESVTRANSKTFYMASNLLPIEKKKAIRSIYAFCRVTDDIVDRGGSQSGTWLKRWEQQVLHWDQHQDTEYPDQEKLVALAWHAAQKRYTIPALYAEQLIDGVSRDLLKNRYQTFDDLVAYCYGVACTVGLMAMHVIGFSDPDTIPYAIRLGVALQLTNILRDVGEDWRMGRLYLPKEELEAFGLTEEDIARGNVTDRWHAFMRFQIDRVRLLYASAMPGIVKLHSDGRFAIGASAELYRAILLEIEKNEDDVFYHRAVVSTTSKLRCLPGIWWRARTASYPAEQNLSSLSAKSHHFLEVKS